MNPYSTYLNRFRQSHWQRQFGDDEPGFGGGGRGCGHGRGARFAGGPYARGGGPGGPGAPEFGGREFEGGEFRGPEFGGGPFGPGGPGGPFGPRGPFGPGGPSGPGGPGGPFWGSGRGGRGPGRRRRGEVRNALLLLLAQEPRNGYQLMQEIEERSGGRWRPSPGSVYPALSQLEDEGLVRNVPNESGRAFEITDAGREQAERLAGQAPPWQTEDDPSERSTHALRHLIMSTGMAAWQVAKDGDETQIAAACDVLAQTRRALYGILAGEPQEQREPSSQPGSQADDVS